MVIGGVPMPSYRMENVKMQEVRWRSHLLLTQEAPNQVSHFEQKENMLCRVVTESPLLGTLAGKCGIFVQYLSPAIRKK